MPMSLPPRQHRSRRGARNIRNAAIGIPIGIITIVAGIVLSLFRCGIFAEHSNEFALGVIVFCVGYCAVIFGCWSWANAKHLNDAIVIIGLAPLFLLLIPYVRLIFFFAPQLIVVGMIMMPTILIAIIAVLPSNR